MELVHELPNSYILYIIIFIILADDILCRICRSVMLWVIFKQMLGTMLSSIQELWEKLMQSLQFFFKPQYIPYNNFHLFLYSIWLQTIRQNVWYFNEPLNRTSVIYQLPIIWLPFFSYAQYNYHKLSPLVEVLSTQHERDMS